MLADLNAHRPCLHSCLHSRQVRATATCHRRHGHVTTCAALFDLWSPGQLREGFAYKGSDALTVGPFPGVAPLGAGTWAWGNKLLWGYDKSRDAELQEVFNLLVSRGINLFDTADSYGTGQLNGRSEQLLGDFLRSYPGKKRTRDGVLIATKLAPYPWRVTPGQFVGACKASLRRLGLDQLAIGQLHWSTANYQPLQERALWGGLAALHDQGLVRAVGVSNYGPRQLERIHAYLERRGVPLASLQVQYSLISQGPLQRDIQATCEALGIALIAYSPLGLGMLTGKYDAGTGRYPPGPRGLLFRQIMPGLGELLGVLRAVAAERGRSMPQVALNWCRSQGTLPIPGFSSVAAVRDNVGALEWRLAGAEAEALTAAADRIPRGMLQNVFQTK